VQPPPLPTQIDVLQRVLDRVTVAAADGGPVPVVVFGLDGTLFDTRPRTLQILLEYADEVAADDVDLANALRELSAERVHYLLSETLAECGVRHADVVRDVTSYWRERFHSDEYCGFDDVPFGAVDYVRKIHRAGGSVVYVSGRDVPGMLLGTVTMLRDQGYPIAEPGVQLALKPDATLGNESFKRQVFKRISAEGDVVAAFHSRGSICMLARHAFGGADIGLIDTWSDGADGLDEGANVHVVSDFRI